MQQHPASHHEHHRLHEPTGRFVWRAVDRLGGIELCWCAAAGSVFWDINSLSFVPFSPSERVHKRAQTDNIDQSHAL